MAIGTSCEPKKPDDTVQFQGGVSRGEFARLVRRVGQPCRGEVQEVSKQIHSPVLFQNIRDF
jgi:hypothetical protein